MNATQEPKYRIEGNKLVNRQSGNAIPDDEPVMVFRARDKHAVAAIKRYMVSVADRAHAEAVAIRLRQFEAWAVAHPDRMREPDTQVTDDWKKWEAPTAVDGATT